MPDRYAAPALVDFAAALLAGAGMDGDKAQVTAALLVEADLMGHTTHGLQLCAPYVDELRAGRMAATGEPEVVADRGATLAWDGRRLPGLWLTARAVDRGIERATTHGLCAIAVRRSHHIGCLAAFLPRATAQGLMVTIACSDPAAASVAPHGGTRAVFTPDPIAVGIPTDGDPILIDISASITTNGLTQRLHREGRRLPGPWVIDAAGRAGDDPAVLFADPPGTILPVGGLDHGHKGYALALMIEALTQGLSGHGRADPAEGWGASVFVQVIDPDAFGGREAFQRQTGWVAEACRGNPPRPGADPVRLPGAAALERRRVALRDGVVLHPGIIDVLTAAAAGLGVRPPRPIA